MKILNR